MAGFVNASAAGDSGQLALERARLEKASFPPRLLGKEKRGVIVRLSSR